ncbi:MAG: hypothetical protein GYB65_21365, partial [Chloroflexi bacterium]|nr:hypothetical protein [Chloroflexota bacterium]
RVHDQTWLRLTSSPSGGIGFLAILIVLLASLSIILTPFVSFVFAVLTKGGTTIELRFQNKQGIELHNSLVNVLQGALVLLVLLAFGVRNRFFPARGEQPDDELVERT